MTTQAQGKSKKKNKATANKLSLDEFNNTVAPVGHTVVSVSKVPGLDWAAMMADHDQSTVETQQIVVPTETRAQRGPNVDLDSLPNSPPFKASLYNVPMAAEEKDIIERFFQGLEVLRVDIQKATTTVEFSCRDDLYDALCKDGQSFKGRTISVCLYGHAPPSNNLDRFGRGGERGYGDRGYNNDRGGQSGGFAGYRSSDRYGDRSGGFNDRPGYDRPGGFNDRQGYDRPGFDRPGFDRPGGFGDRGRDGGFDRNREGGFVGYNRGGSAGFRGPSRSGGASGGYGQRFQEGGNFRDNPRGYTSGGGEPEPEEPKDWRARPTINRPAPPPQNIPHHHQPLHQHQAPISPPSEDQGEDRPVRKSYKNVSKTILSQIVKTE